LRKNSGYNRRVILTLVVMATLALVGVTMIKVDPAGAQAGPGVGKSASLSGSQVGDAERSAPGAGDESDGTSPPSIVAAVVKMISALAVVIAVVYGALYLLRKLMGRRYGGAAGGGSLEVLQTTYVGPHKAISLVRVGRRSVLVGVTDNHISTLTELDPEETDEITTRTDHRTVRSESFSRALSGAVVKLKTVGLKKKQAALET